MARGRSDSAGAWVALVIVSGAFVIALIVAILFYTKIEKAEADAAVAEKDLSRFVNASVQRDSRIESRMGGNGPVVKQLLDEDYEVKNLIKSGADIMGAEDVKAEFNNLVQSQGLSATTYTQAINELVSNVGQLQADLAAKDQQLADMQASIEAAEQELADGQAQMEQAIADFRQKAESAVAQLGEGASFIDDRLAELEQSFDNTNQGLQSQLAQLNEAKAATEAELGEYKEALSTLGGGPTTIVEALNARTRPDGKVTDAFDDKNIVISIGQNQRVLPGMTFEVFEPNAVVRVAEDNMGNASISGKARLEVVSVKSDTAVCRVVKMLQPGSVNTGDVIVNLVYDPNYAYSFLVYGEFDLDNSGAATVRDRTRVESMIERWGGRLFGDELKEGQAVALNSPAGRFTYRQPQLPAGLDFVVLGAEPQLPEATPDPDFASPDEVRAYNEQFAKLQKYQDLIAQARTLGVPVLNQNRFLSLVGYYER